MDDLISRQEAIEALRKAEPITRAFGYHNVIYAIRELPSAQPKIIKCKDCKNSPLKTWLNCPLSHLPFDGERWCWKGEQDE